jgi:hypothetical protein
MIATAATIAAAGALLIAGQATASTSTPRPTASTASPRSAPTATTGRSRVARPVPATEARRAGRAVPVATVPRFTG